MSPDNEFASLQARAALLHSLLEVRQRQAIKQAALSFPKEAGLPGMLGRGLMGGLRGGAQMGGNLGRGLMSGLGRQGAQLGEGLGQRLAFGAGRGLGLAAQGIHNQQYGLKPVTDFIGGAASGLRRPQALGEAYQAASKQMTSMGKNIADELPQIAHLAPPAAAGTGLGGRAWQGAKRMVGVGIDPSTSVPQESWAGALGQNLGKRLGNAGYSMTQGGFLSPWRGAEQALQGVSQQAATGMPTLAGRMAARGSNLWNKVSPFLSPDEWPGGLAGRWPGMAMMHYGGNRAVRGIGGVLHTAGDAVNAVTRIPQALDSAVFPGLGWKTRAGIAGAGIGLPLASNAYLQGQQNAGRFKEEPAEGFSWGQDPDLAAASWGAEPVSSVAGALGLNRPISKAVSTTARNIANSGGNADTIADHLFNVPNTVSDTVDDYSQKVQNIPNTVANKAQKALANPAWGGQ